MSAPSIHITDHGLLRWLERSGALDVEAVRAALAGSLERAGVAAAQLGVAQFAIAADGLLYVVRDGRLTTVTTDRHLGDRIRATTPATTPATGPGRDAG